MKTVSCTIQGTSGLLINRFKENDEIPAVMTKGKKDYGSPRHQAEQTAYKDEGTNRLWIPTSWISGTIATVASDYKLTKSKKSIKSVSGGAIVPVQAKVYFDEEYVLEDIEVDSRPVQVQRARIMRHRAKLETWTISFDLEIDDAILEPDQVHGLLSDAGRRAGMGDFRPPKGGPFGKFIIVSWKVLKEENAAPVAKPVVKAKDRKKVKDKKAA